MALAVDPAPFARDLAEYNSGTMALIKSHGRYYVRRVSVFAAILSDSILNNFDEAVLDHDVRPLTAAQQAALDWQVAEEGEPLEDSEVLHNLMHISNCVCPFERRTSVVATIQAAQFDPLLQAQGRPMSTYRNFSVRRSFMASYFNSSLVDTSWCHRSKCLPDDPWFWMWARCKLDSATPVGVHWTLQLDYMDLDTPTTHFQHVPTHRKRRRTTMLPMGLPFRDSAVIKGPNANQTMQGQRRYKGVRYRNERKTWVAEMKPPTSKNKVSFGDFKSPLAAARAVDAAFFYFGKQESMNFPDSAQNLPPFNCDAQQGENYSKAKLKFVQVQAKRLAKSLAASCVLESTRHFAFDNGVYCADAGAMTQMSSDIMSSAVPTLTTQLPSMTFAGDQMISGPQPALRQVLLPSEATAAMSSSFDAASRLHQLGVHHGAEFHPFCSALQCSSLDLQEHGIAHHHMNSLESTASYLKELEIYPQDIDLWCSSPQMR